VLLSSRNPGTGNTAGEVTTCRPSDPQGNVVVVAPPHCTDPLVIAIVYTLPLLGHRTKQRRCVAQFFLELSYYIRQNRPLFMACSKYPTRFACREISVSRHGYDYLPIVLQHHKHGSPPRATPPRSRCTRAAPPLPDLTTHDASDGYAVVIGNLYKHKCPRPRPDHTTMPIYAVVAVKIRMHKRATHARPHHDPGSSAWHPTMPIYAVVSVKIRMHKHGTPPCATPPRPRCTRGPTLAGALSSNGCLGLPLPQLYIYILILKTIV
jgi:hypothetical protein